MKEPFFINPFKKTRRLVAFGLKRAANPRRRKKVRKNPPTKVHFPSHDETLFRIGSSGRWGTKRRKKKGALKKLKSLFRRKIRRASPAHTKGVAPMAKHRKSHRRAKHVRRSTNPFVKHRRRSHRRSSNPILKSVGKLGLPPMKEVLWLTAGAISARMLIPRAIALLPMLSANGYIRAGSRVVISAVASLLATKVLKGNAKPFIYGVLANQVPEAVNDIAAQAGFKLGMEDAENELSLGTYYGNDTRPALAATEVGMYTGMEMGEEGVVEVGG